MDFNFGLLPLVGRSLKVIVFTNSLFANFSNQISFKFAKQPKADLLIGFSKRANTSPDPSRMLHLSHSKRAFCHNWNNTFVNIKMFIHSFVDSTFNMGFNVSLNFYATCKTTRRINNRSKNKGIFHNIM